MTHTKYAIHDSLHMENVEANVNHLSQLLASLQTKVYLNTYSVTHTETIHIHCLHLQLRNGT